MSPRCAGAFLVDKSILYYHGRKSVSMEISTIIVVENYYIDHCVDRAP
jgi:hypothetical protein